jgi:DNA-binding MarR family transcriptional regulator
MIVKAGRLRYLRGLPRRRHPDQFLEQLAAVKKRVTALATDAYAEVGVGITQGKMLRHLGAHGPVSQAELARATESDPTLTGRLLAPLVERGLIRRERSAVDRREYVLELGAAGRRLVAKIETQWAAVGARIAAALDDRDLADFERIAAKILAATDAS